MTSLGDKLVHLSLEIEDRKKSAELLRQLISDQSSRHASELSKYLQDQEALLEKLTSERKAAQSEITRLTESLAQKKSALETQLNDALAKKKAAEDCKRKQLEAFRKEIADAKEAAYQQHKQERAEREKAWYDGRVAEIHKLTWKGIQPNINKLTQKHKVQCEEIRSKTSFAKQKLELQCENDLAERIQAFQRSEQQSNACITQRSEFTNLLLREQNEHATSLAKLKERFAREEEATKSMYTLQLETLAKEHEVALSKIRSSKSVQQLTHELAAKKAARLQELEASIERVGREANSAKEEWETTWLEASAASIEKKNKQKKEELYIWRKAEIDGLIRRSILDQKGCDSPEGTRAALVAEHEENVAALKESLEKQKVAIEETKKRTARLSARKGKLTGSIETMQEELNVVGNKLDDITNHFERQRRRQQAQCAESTKDIAEKLRALTQRRDDIARELADAQERIREDAGKHNAEKDALMKEHEQKLEELQSYALESAQRIDDKLRKVKLSSKEQQVYFARAQSLLNTRYKAN